ncbi:hypothetical protein PV328_000372 [Microctonus aethiopoides]|uniref:Beta-adaptin appendage C-terminal subdomain domain-containing protein n=1 Tax=Microctonus aethiopoides TaxID=144406 RepID=A0AA39KWJ3_9HYME|nr:hypothetical protein PV328_000372 [Microctonus aethiopoides]
MDMVRRFMELELDENDKAIELDVEEDKPFLKEIQQKSKNFKLPGASVEVSIISSTTGAVQRMDPLDNLQVVIKNNIEDGQLDKKVFSSTCKEIPVQNEQNNIFTIVKRNVKGQDMLYQSLKLTNNVWVLNELKIQPGNPDVTLSLKSRTVEVTGRVFQSYNAIFHS